MPAAGRLDGKPLRVSSGLLTAAHQDLVRPVLVAQLRSVALSRFLHCMSASSAGTGGSDCFWTYKLDGDLLAVEEVHALKDDAERALANLLPDSVVHPHDVRRRRRHFVLDGRSWSRDSIGLRVSSICNRVEPSVLGFNRPSWRPSMRGRMDVNEQLRGEAVVL